MLQCNKPSINTNIVNTNTRFKMLDYLTNLISFFTFKRNDHLEAYITSKNPQNAAEVDHWMREYDRKTKFMAF